MWGPGHQSDVELVELFRVNIELHIGQTQIWRNLGLRIPEDRLAVARAVVDVDVHVELFLAGDDGGVNQSHAGNFVPHVARQRVLVEILRNRGIGFRDVAFISSVKRVFTEMSMGVIVTFFQGARSTIRAASGSNHQLNSRRASMAPGSIAPLFAYNPPPIMTNSFAKVATSGSSFSARAYSVRA